MYLEIFLPLAFGGLGGIVYKKWRESRDLEYNNEIELWDDLDDESCPLIMFDKNGNYYYVYE